MFRPFQNCLASALVLASICLAAATARAAEPAVWKFTKDAKNRYRLTQDMAMTMNLGPGGEVATNTTNVMDMSWVVKEVKDDGSAVVQQKIERIRMTMKAPGGAVAEFDTESTDEPQGFAAMIAPLFREMTRSEFTVTMSPRGAISDVEVPEALTRALAASPGAQALGELATAEGLKKMVSGVAFELPETLEPGKEWTTTAEMSNPVLGTQTIKTTYRYDGPKEADGAHLESFTPKLEVSFAGSDAVTVKVTEQTSSGEMLFNRDAGRLQSTQLHHTMAMDFATGGQNVSQSLVQDIKFQWLPEDAE